MSPTEQRIRQLRFAVTVATSADALELRRRLRADLYDRLLPAFDRALEEVNVEERRLSVPRVELRLRFDSPEAALAQLPERIHHELLAALRTLTPEDGARLIPLEEAHRDELWHYLETGNTLDHCTSTPQSPREALRECLHDRLGETLRWLAGRPAAAWFRCLQLLGVGERTSLGSSELRPILNELLVDPATSPSAHRRLQLAAEILAAQASADAPALAAATTLARESLASARRSTTTQLSRSEPRPGRAPHAVEPAHECLDTAPPPAGSQSLAPSADPAGGRRVEPGEPPSRSTDGVRASSTPASVGSTSEPTSPTFVLRPPDAPARAPASAWSRPQTSSALATPVRAAGLVLLHPFLPALLTRLGLALPIPAPLPESSLAPAAALLHFLATGEDEPLELELGSIKLLLGLRPDTPLPVGGGLVDAAARDEAHALLASVIQHWTALGQTSIDGLRTTFLRRFGIVRAVEGGDRLDVEPGPFDMLLDRLPWGVSVVKLPWMSRVLFTQWSLA